MFFLSKDLNQENQDRWMDELTFYVPFNSISVISRQWKSEYEGFCAMKCHLASERISPPAGLKNETLSYEVRFANCLAT